MITSEMIHANKSNHLVRDYLETLQHVEQRAIKDSGLKELQEKYDALLVAVQTVLAADDKVDNDALRETLTTHLPETTKEDKRFEYGIQRLRDARKHELEHKAHGEHYDKHMAYQKLDRNDEHEWFTNNYRLEMQLTRPDMKDGSEQFTIFRDEDVYHVESSMSGMSYQSAPTFQDAILHLGYYLGILSES